MLETRFVLLDEVLSAHTAYWRADPEDMSVLDGPDDRRRAELILERLKLWKSIGAQPLTPAAANTASSGEP